MLDELYAFRVFDKNSTPCLSALQYDGVERIEHFIKRPQQKEIDVQDVIKGRISTESAIRQAFEKKGGKPVKNYCLYFAIGKSVPDYILKGFANPAYIKIPLEFFRDKPVSFLYGNAAIAFFRKDHHETKRKIYLYEEIGKVIEKFGLSIEYDNKKSYVEMHLWDPQLISNYYDYIHMAE